MHPFRLHLLLPVGLVAVALADFHADDSCAGPECGGEPLLTEDNSMLQAKTRKKYAESSAKQAMARSLVHTAPSSPTMLQGKGMAPEGGVSKRDMMKILVAIKSADEAGKLVELEPELKGSNKPSAFKRAVAFMMGKREGGSESSVAEDSITPEEEKVFLTQLGEHTEEVQENLATEVEGSTQLLPLEVQKQISLMLRERSHLKLKRGQRRAEGLPKWLKKVPKTTQKPPPPPTGEVEKDVREAPSEVDEGEYKMTLSRLGKQFKATWSDDEAKEMREKTKALGRSTISQEELRAFNEVVCTRTEGRMTQYQKRIGHELARTGKSLLPPELMFRQLKSGRLQAKLVSEVRVLKDHLRAKRKKKRSKWAKRLKENIKRLKRRAKWFDELLNKTEDQTVEDDLDD